MLKYLQINTLYRGRGRTKGEVVSGIETISKTNYLFKSRYFYIRSGQKQHRLCQRCSLDAHCDYNDPVEVHIQLLCWEGGMKTKFLFLTDV